MSQATLENQKTRNNELKIEDYVEENNIDDTLQEMNLDPPKAQRKTKFNPDKDIR